MKFSSLFTLSLVFSLITVTSSFAQKNVKYNEGSSPVVKIYMDNDTSKVVTKLKKNTANKVKVVILGGINKVKSSVYVTSKNASVTKVAGTVNEYIVIPQDENCELIVDIKLLESFFAFKETDVKGKKVRKLEKEYIPKTYMLAYETIPTF